MGRTIWQIGLDISTLLGGLAALVFFYDRFGHLLTLPKVKQGLASSARRKALLSFWATVAILIGCGIISSIGFLKSPFYQLITGLMIELAGLFFVKISREMRGISIRKLNALNFLIHLSFSVSFAGLVHPFSILLSGFGSTDNDYALLARLSPLTAYVGAAICTALGIGYCFLAFRPAQREKSWS